VTRSEYNRLVDLVEGMQDMMANLDYRITGLEDFKDLENKIVAPPPQTKSKQKNIVSPPVGSLERRLNALRRGGRQKSKGSTRRSGRKTRRSR
jgi:hypothetical protein